MPTVVHAFSTLTPLPTVDGTHYRTIFIHDKESDSYECWYDRRLKIVYTPEELPPEVTEALAYIRSIPPRTVISMHYDYQAYENRHDGKLDTIGWKSGVAFGREVYCVVLPASFVSDTLDQYMKDRHDV